MQLSQKTDISVQKIRLIESGKRNVKYPEVLAIAKALECESHQLLDCSK